MSGFVVLGCKGIPSLPLLSRRFFLEKPLSFKTVGLKKDR